MDFQDKKKCLDANFHKQDSSPQETIILLLNSGFFSTCFSISSPWSSPSCWPRNLGVIRLAEAVVAVVADIN